MTDTLLVLVMLALLVLSGLGLWWLFRQSRVLRSRVRETVVVTCHGGAAFRGVLFEDDGKVLVLRDATLMSGPNGSHVPVDGEVLVFAAEVHYVQVLS